MMNLLADESVDRPVVDRLRQEDNEVVYAVLASRHSGLVAGLGVSRGGFSWRGGEHREPLTP